mmetsp:Transcript_64648/g.140787  ORF Transcript_64648/g.140787 Transcript_64648/m.140787 type:complete len:248 (-) Transcript_64648:1035-1778(-)
MPSELTAKVRPTGHGSRAVACSVATVGASASSPWPASGQSRRHLRRWRLRPECCRSGRVTGLRPTISTAEQVGTTQHRAGRKLEVRRGPASESMILHVSVPVLLVLRNRRTWYPRRRETSRQPLAGKEVLKPWGWRQGPATARRQAAARKTLARLPLPWDRTPPANAPMSSTAPASQRWHRFILRFGCQVSSRSTIGHLTLAAELPGKLLGLSPQDVEDVDLHLAPCCHSSAASCRLRDRVPGSRVQ